MTTQSIFSVNDSYQFLNTIDNRFFDVTITDPPYSRHCQENQTSGTALRLEKQTGGKSIPKIDLPFEPIRHYEFARDLVRVTKRWVLIFCTIEDVGKFSLAAPDQFVRGGVWYKPNSMGQISKDRPAAAYEALAILHRDGPMRWNGKGSYGVWKCNGTRGKKGRHPSEKPVPLMMKLAALFSDRGETVFDPFAGSAAIGEACKRLGRGYVGWERDTSWVHKGNQRLKSCCLENTDKHALSLCRMSG